MICRADQLTGFYMMATLVFNELNPLKTALLMIVSISVLTFAIISSGALKVLHKPCREANIHL